MPQMVAFLNYCADNIEQIVFEYEHSNPYVINVFPIINSTAPTTITEICVDFSTKMHNCSGMMPTKDSTLIFPETTEMQRWSENEK